MANLFENIGEIEVMGDIWNCTAQSPHNNDVNIIARNDQLMPLGGTQYMGPDYGYVPQTLLDNGMNYHGTSNINAYHAPFLLEDLNVDLNVDFEQDGTMMLGDDMFESGRASPCLLPPMNINVPMQPQPKTRRDTTREKTRRKSVLHTENSFIQSLRAQNIPWKKISELFSQRFGKVMSNASLQMRMIRRRKRAGIWRYSDIKLLREAYNYWETKKFAIIARKLQELGASQTYTERQVEFQLQHSQHE
ncbi:hypothetical protein UA08_07035 [Talaromyces atroroseus]|uniref:Uncharacterized protein n=1 Tax=Talaromyces atroroseus TaxID=1441469 RepID=A0A225AEP3_TALAT|nr:hypothetical protein UA08_07035 [Talaromyces atroroseus]OKL57543.1 hypothetical protein UA08_07035 [Talaromyces atroroseus]